MGKPKKQVTQNTQKGRNPGAIKRNGIADVARLANVSQAAASRLLRGDPTFSARAETRAQVEAAARKLDFVSDARAQALRQRQSQIVGVLVDNFRGSYVNAAFRCFSERLAAARKEILLGLYSGNDEMARRHINSFRAYRTCATLILSQNETLSPAIIESLRAGAAECGPILDVSFSVDPPPALPSLNIDIEWVADEFARTAAGAGYNHAVLAMRTNVKFERMQTLLRRACGQFPHLAWDAICHPTPYPETLAEEVCRKAQALCRHGSRAAIMTTVDTDAVAIVQRLMADGLQVPGEVGVVGYGNFGSDRFTPVEITTFDVIGAIPRMAQRAMERLGLIEQKTAAAAENEAFRPALLIHASCVPSQYQHAGT